MTQHGFFVDLSRCIGCNACVIACKQWHSISPGPIKWMGVHQWEEGLFPNTRIHILPVMCYHCEKPVCIHACRNEAIFKETKYRAVLIDSEKCKGERRCWQVCPYGAPQYSGDNKGLKMSNPSSPKFPEFGRLAGAEMAPHAWKSTENGRNSNVVTHT